MAQNTTMDIKSITVERKPRRGSMVWIVVAIGLVLVLAVLQFITTRETVSELEVVSAEGTAGRALIVYNHDLIDYQQRLTSAFANGLSERDWQVTRTTTSRLAPAELSDYDLLVLGVHTYWWSPDRPTQRYLQRLSDLDGKPTVTLISGLGATGRAERLIREQIEAVNGAVIEVQPFWIMRPNDENDGRSNNEVALDMAYQQGVATADTLR